jgi:hypothetical protein
MELNDLTFREGFALPTPRIPLIALTDTNNPQSAIARLTLSESRLECILDLPIGTKDFEIVCSSDGVPLGGLIWRFVGTLPPTNQPGFPPPPPTGGGGVIIIIIRPPIPGRPLPPPPPLLGNQILTLNAPSPPVVIEPPRPPATPRVVTMMIPTELWPRVTNGIALSEQQMQLFRDGFGIMRFFNDTNVLIGTAFIRQTDGDEDGVPDSMDHCPSTVTGSLVDTEGCSIEQLAPCDGPWRNHGEFVNAFKAVTSHFLGQGLITAKRCRELNAAAAQSDCGSH